MVSGTSTSGTLEDNSEWEAWVTEDGIVTGPTVTLDSISIPRGRAGYLLYMDYVAQNTQGSLAPQEGDLDGDGDVDAADFAYWRSEYGNGMNGANFLEWQRNLVQTVASADAVAVPEPSGLLILLVMGCTGAVRRLQG